MNDYSYIKPSQLKDNIFEKIGSNWMLVGACNGDKANALTASWGGLGVLFNNEVAIIFIRKSRYTKELIDSAEKFSLSFFERPKYDEVYKVFGSVSGRDEDKIARCGLTVDNSLGAPLFAEAQMTMICRKVVRQPLELDNILDKEIVNRFYPNGDPHDIYIGEILDILVK